MYTKLWVGRGRRGTNRIVLQQAFTCIHWQLLLFFTIEGPLLLFVCFFSFTLSLLTPPPPPSTTPSLSLSLSLPPPSLVPHQNGEQMWRGTYVSPASSCSLIYPNRSLLFSDDRFELQGLGSLQDCISNPPPTPPPPLPLLPVQWCVVCVCQMARLCGDVGNNIPASVVSFCPQPKC